MKGVGSVRTRRRCQGSMRVSSIAGLAGGRHSSDGKLDTKLAAIALDLVYHVFAGQPDASRWHAHGSLVRFTPPAFAP